MEMIDKGLAEYINGETRNLIGRLCRDCARQDMHWLRLWMQSHWPMWAMTQNTINEALNDNKEPLGERLRL